MSILEGLINNEDKIMIKKQELIRGLNWLQLIFSIMFALTITFGYFAYHVPIKNIVSSLVNSIISVSRVMEETVKTIEAKQDVIKNSKQTLTKSRELINSSLSAAENQIKLIPQYSNTIQSASNVFIGLGNTLGQVGAGFAFSIPSLNTDKFPPTIQKTQPLLNEAKLLKDKGEELERIGKDLFEITSTVKNDGAKIGIAYVETAKSALIAIENIEKSLDTIQGNDLPIALKEMKGTAENLKKISESINSGVNQIGLILFVLGLLFSGWCFVHSLSLLMMSGLLTDYSIKSNL